MFKNGKIILVAVFFSAAFFSVNIFTSFADKATCSGRVEGYSCNANDISPYPGETGDSCVSDGFMYPSPEDGNIPFRFDNMLKGHNNINAGVTEFNSHPGSGYYDANGDEYIADLGIVEPGLMGFAPENPGIEVCLDGETVDYTDIGNAEIPLKGFAWNTNLGFISFDCTDGQNLGEPCGTDAEYHTVLGRAEFDADGNEVRSFIKDDNALKGYAWNPTFGYIQFSGEGAPVPQENNNPFKASYSPVSVMVNGVPAYNFTDKFIYACSKIGSGEVVAANGQEVSCADGVNPFEWAFIEVNNPLAPIPVTPTKDKNILNVTCTNSGVACAVGDKIGGGTGSTMDFVDGSDQTGWQVDNGFQETTLEVNLEVPQDIKEVHIKHQTPEPNPCGAMCPNNIIRIGTVKLTELNGTVHTLSINNINQDGTYKVTDVTLSGFLFHNIKKITVSKPSDSMMGGAGWRPSEISWLDVLNPSVPPAQTYSYWTVLLRKDKFQTSADITSWLDQYPGISGKYKVLGTFITNPTPSVVPVVPADGSAVIEYSFSLPSILPPPPINFSFVGGPASLNRSAVPSNPSNFTYGVVAKREAGSADPFWYLEGEAYTSAGVYLNFDGVRILLPHSTEGCSGTDQVCMEVLPNPLDRKYNYSSEFASSDETLFSPVADGMDGYRIAVYPRTPTGEIKLDQYSMILDAFVWSDTVRLNQVKGAGDKNIKFDTDEDANSKGGAVNYKPINLSDPEFALTAENVENMDMTEDTATCLESGDGSPWWCKQEVVDENGDVVNGADGNPVYRYILKKKITSYAPTTDANVSAVTSAEPSYTVNNEGFVSDEFYPTADRLTTANKNKISLLRVNYSVKENAGVSQPASGEFSFGELGLPLSFRPAIYLDILFANKNDDILTEFANLATPFTMGLAEATGGPGAVQPGFRDVVEPGSLKLDILLKYARNAVVDDCATVLAGGINKDLVVRFEDGGSEEDATPYRYDQNNGSDPAKLGLPGDIDGTRTVTVPGEPIVDPVTGEPTGEIGDPITEQQPTTLTIDISELFDGNVVDKFLAMFAFPDVIPPEICNSFRGAVLYSEVSYKTPEGAAVKYYSNKLPRIPNALMEAGAVISGNIGAQFVGGTSNDSGVPNIPMYSKSDQTLNKIRNLISQNIKKNLDGNSDVICESEEILPNLDFFKAPFSGLPCGMIKQLRRGSDIVAYMPFSSENDVHISVPDISTLAFDSTKSYLLLVDGGNVYIDGNLYGDISPKNFTIVVLRKNGGLQGDSGNVFVKYSVKNINATVFADGVVTSYVPENDLDPNAPTVDFAMPTLLNDIETEYKSKKGAVTPPEDVSNKLTQLFTILKERGYQLNWQGGIASKNTIGGASNDILTKYEMYLGKGNLPEKDKSVAQLFDLNYLRFFRLRLELCPETETPNYDCFVPEYNSAGDLLGSNWTAGLPIDQKCKKGLTNSDVLDWIAGLPIKNSLTGASCDGINPSKAFIDGGDLVPLAMAGDEEKLADGLCNKDIGNNKCSLTVGGSACKCQYSPLYINYETAPESFLFSTQ